MERGTEAEAGDIQELDRTVIKLLDTMQFDILCNAAQSAALAPTKETRKECGGKSILHVCAKFYMHAV